MPERPRSTDAAFLPRRVHSSFCLVCGHSPTNDRYGVDCGPSVLPGMIKLDRLPHEQLFGLFHIGARVSPHSPCPVEIMRAEW